jgi:hypothetical protein
MASMKSIGRLYAQVKTDNLADLIKPDCAQVKTANFANLERSLPVRSRFKVSPPEPEAYTLDRSEILSMVNANVPPDRTGAFAELAARDRAQSYLEQRVRRGDASSLLGPGAIQT